MNDQQLHEKDLFYNRIQAMQFKCMVQYHLTPGYKHWHLIWVLFWVLLLHLPFSSLLKCLGRQQRMTQVLGPYTHVQDPEEALGSWLLVSDWLGFGCWRHFGIEPVGGSSVFPSICKSAFPVPASLLETFQHII